MYHLESENKKGIAADQQRICGLGAPRGQADNAASWRHLIERQKRRAAHFAALLRAQDLAMRSLDAVEKSHSSRKSGGSRKKKNQRIVNIDLDGTKSRLTSMSTVPLLRSSPLCAAWGENQKRADAASGPGCGLPPLASQRQHAARPECSSRVICGFSIAGCTVDLNHHYSAKRSGR